MSKESLLAAYEGYLPLADDARLDRPEGFSNFLSRYYIPFYVATSRYFGDLPKRVVQSLSDEERTGMALHNRPVKFIKAAGFRGRVFAARGIHGIRSDVARARDFDRELVEDIHASGRYGLPSARRYVSYSLNVAQAANVFALRHKYYERDEDLPHAVVVGSLDADDIVDWGGDSESGPLNEAEVHVRPNRSIVRRRFLYAREADLPIVREPSDFALGHFILCTGNVGPWTIETKLHPYLSDESQYMLRSLGFDLEVHDINESGFNWYEVE